MRINICVPFDKTLYRPPFILGFSFLMHSCTLVITLSHARTQRTKFRSGGFKATLKLRAPHALNFKATL